MTPIRLALVGFGKWGRNYVKAAEDSGEAVVIAVAVRNESDTTRRDILLHGVPQRTDRPDAVVFAGHPSHATMACEQALAAGFPILCEKPAGLSLADAERIAAAEAKSKAFVLVGHQHLFAEGFEALRQVDDGMRRTIVKSVGPAVRDYSPQWDYGPHAVAMALALGESSMFCLAGKVGTMRGARGWTMFGRSEEKQCSAWLGSDDGASISYDAYAPAEPALTRQVRAFARAVRAGGTDDYRFGAKWAIDVARILEAAQ